MFSSSNDICIIIHFMYIISKFISVVAALRRVVPQINNQIVHLVVYGVIICFACLDVAFNMFANGAPSVNTNLRGSSICRL